MKRPLIAFFFFLVFFGTALFVDKSNSTYILIVLAVLLFLFLIFSQYKILYAQLEGDLIFRKQNIRVRLIFIFLTLICVSGLYKDRNHEFVLLEILLFGAIVLSDIISHFLGKKHKPIGIVIKGEQLLLNNFEGTSRDLRRLISIQLNGFTNDIKFTFAYENRLYIHYSEYHPEEIQKLISACVEKSHEKVFVSHNLRTENE